MAQTARVTKTVATAILVKVVNDKVRKTLDEVTALENEDLEVYFESCTPEELRWIRTHHSNLIEPSNKELAENIHQVNVDSPTAPKRLANVVERVRRNLPPVERNSVVSRQILKARTHKVGSPRPQKVRKAPVKVVPEVKVPVVKEILVFEEVPTPKVEPKVTETSKAEKTTDPDMIATYKICSGPSSSYRKALKNANGITEVFRGKFAQANLFRTLATMKGWTEFPEDIQGWLDHNQPKTAKATKVKETPKATAEPKDNKTPKGKVAKPTNETSAIPQWLESQKDGVKITLQAIKDKKVTTYTFKEIRDAYGVKADCRKTSTIVDVLTTAIEGMISNR